MTALSNRQRRQLAKSIPAAPRYAKPATAQVASAARAVQPEAAQDRDGLEWLERKGRLSPPRKKAGEYARGVFRAAPGPSLRSCLDVTISSQGKVPDGLLPVEVSADAKRQLFALKWVVLGGQDDLITVVEGVCGGGHTLRALAGQGSSDQVKARAMVLEKVLMIALDLIAHHLESELR